MQILKQPENPSVTHYINRYWTVSSSGISGFSCDITAIYDEFDIVGDEDEYWGGKWDGAAWSLMNECDPLTNTITGSVSSFSDFTAGENAAFPVEWLDFRAEAQGDAVRLEWETAWEENSAFFAVERRGEGRPWEQIGSVAAAGRSDSLRSYLHNDWRPLAGKNYYRLRQVDLDGKSQYSRTVELNFEAGGFAAYPNPVRDWLTVAASSEAVREVRILDLSGREVRQVILRAGEARVSLEDLPPGIYSARVQLEGGQARNIPFVKE